MMKESRKKNMPQASCRASLYPLYEICGKWESPWGSPAIQIYHDGTRFRLVYEYNPNATFTFPLQMDSMGNIFFYFYDRMFLTYNGDGEEELLMLSTEGTYKRVYD